MFDDLTKAQQYKMADGIYRALRDLRVEQEFSDADLKKVSDFALNRLTVFEDSGKSKTSGLTVGLEIDTGDSIINLDKLKSKIGEVNATLTVTKEMLDTYNDAVISDTQVPSKEYLFGKELERLYARINKTVKERLNDSDEFCVDVADFGDAVLQSAVYKLRKAGWNAKLSYSAVSLYLS